MHDRKPAANHVKSEWLRLVLICVGWISIAAGVVGIFLPLVPSVPFLLLALFCFSRSSERFHNWLVEHKHLGPMLRDYLLHGGIHLRGKAMAIGMIWISFPVSTYLFAESLWLKVLLISVAVAVTWYLIVIPTVSRGRPEGGAGTGAGAGKEEEIRKNGGSS